MKYFFEKTILKLILLAFSLFFCSSLRWQLQLWEWWWKWKCGYDGEGYLNIFLILMNTKKLMECRKQWLMFY